MARRLKKFGDSFKSGPTTKCGRKNLLQKVCSTLGSPSHWSYHPLNLPSTKRSWNLTPTSTRAPAATYRWAQQHFSQSKSMPCAFCTGLKAYLFVEEILTGILRSLLAATEHRYPFGKKTAQNISSRVWCWRMRKHQPKYQKSRR